MTEAEQRAREWLECAGYKNYFSHSTEDRMITLLAAYGSQEYERAQQEDDRDWKLIAQELGCEPIREDMLRLLATSKVGTVLS